MTEWRSCSRSQGRDKSRTAEVYVSSCGAMLVFKPAVQMATAKRDIDDVWCKLKQQRQPNSRSQTFERFWDALSSDASKIGARQAAAGSSRRELQLYMQKTVPQQPTSQAAAAQPPSAFLNSYNLNGAVLDRVLEALGSSDVSTRRAALQQLKTSYCSGDSTLLDSTVAESFSTKLGKGLLRRFDDQAEACRELAVTICKETLQSGPDATLTMLPYAMPVLEERLHIDEATHNPTEPSEEVRLLLMQLLSTILDHAGTAISAYASEVWSMLSAALADSYHEVAMQGCHVAHQLAGSLGLRLGTLAKDIVAALLPLTTHQRHRVRLAAIHAIRDVVHQGAHEVILEMVAWRDPNMVPIKAFYNDDLKVNYFGKLATDQHVQVRLTFLQMIGNWMLTLRERSDHEARVLPYLLNGLCDESTEVVQSALQLLDQLGQLYEQEHEKDLKDLLRFGNAATDSSDTRFLEALRNGTAHYTFTAASTAAHVSTTTADSLTEAPAETPGQAGGAAALHIPGPFTARPRLGSRLLVRNNFGSALGALCGDLSSWQSGPRSMSAKLLLVNLVLAESATMRHLQVLLPALCASIRDPDAGAAVADCATVLGCHCDFALVLDLLEPRLSASVGVEPRRQADDLLVLAAVLRGAGPLRRLAGHSARLLQLLQQSSIAGSQDSNIKAAATAVMQAVLSGGGVQQLLQEFTPAEQQQQKRLAAAEHMAAVDSNSKASIELLVGYTKILLQLAASVTLQVTAAVDSGAATAQFQLTEQLLQQLARAAGYSVIDELLGVCRSHVVEQVTAQLDLHSAADISVFCRPMLPTAVSWILTASPSAIARCREPLASTADYQSWLTHANSSTNGSSMFAAAAETYCNTADLITLCQMVAAAQQTYRKDSQQTPASVVLLQQTLDCCMAAWPAAAFTEPVLAELLHRTLPALLSSTHSLAVMAGMRVLHLALLRGVFGQLVDSRLCASHQHQQQQQHAEQQQAVHQMLVDSWQGHSPQQALGLCQMVCRALTSSVTAVRLEACYLLQCISGILCGEVLVPADSEKQQSGTAATATAPQPAASLAAALNDADLDVRTAVSYTLQQLLQRNSRPGQPEAGWIAQVQQQVLKAAANEQATEQQHLYTVSQSIMLRGAVTMR